MSTVPLFDHHHGCHCRKQRPSFFRRLVAAVRRKPSAPASFPAAGAATALLGDTAFTIEYPEAPRFACCPCCVQDGNRCDPPNLHLAPCQDGCNDPVLGDRWTWEVRADAEAALRARQHADVMHAGYARAVDRLRRDAGLPTVDEMRQEYFALPKREPMRREPGKPPWHTGAMPIAPPAEPWASLYRAADLMDEAARQPEYGEKCVADVLAAGQEGRLAS